MYREKMVLLQTLINVMLILLMDNNKLLNNNSKLASETSQAVLQLLKELKLLRFKKLSYTKLNEIVKNQISLM